MSSGAGVLVVGAGQAGLQLAVSLREVGETGPIIIVGEEPYAPYQRPPLSKAYLLGGSELGDLTLRAPEFFAEKRISVITGQQIRSIELGELGEPGTAHTADGHVIVFDKLALTVGAVPRRLDVPGADLHGVRYLRTADDATVLRSLQADARSVAVIGGGFIGLEAAAVARAQGKAVTVIEAADRLLGRAVAPVVSDFYRAAHSRRGVTMRLGCQVRALRGQVGRVEAVELSDGTAVLADLVIVGIGVLPRIELAEQLGLACDGGIIVDVRARTSNPAVVAAGDCTVAPHPIAGGGMVRLESVQNAVGQAKVAAATLAGAPPTDHAVPWFWSDQFDLKLQIAGLSAGHDHHVVRGDLERESFSVLYYRDDALLAVDAVNAPGDYMAVRKALTQGSNIPADAAGNVALSLRQLIGGPAARV